MPRKPKRPCQHPGCPKLTDGLYCAEHQKKMNHHYNHYQREVDNIVASVRAYREGRHGNEKWANRAQFSEATDLFCFRRIPTVNVTTAMVVVNNEGRFEITSVEDVKGSGMYIEVLAKEVKPSG